MQLTIRQSLVVQSDHTAIQKLFLTGNLTYMNLTKPQQYPANGFEVSATEPSSYEIRVLFDSPGDYTVNLFVKNKDSGLTRNATTYYLSSGPFELDINATFNPHPNDTIPVVASEPPFQNFAKWVGKFGEAFPLWVKLLYFGMGVQFFAVGGLWIRRETSRKESTDQRVDRGDQAYMWVDTAYKFLLASFAAIVAIMGGELLILFILRFMFLASFDFLSLWDLFVIGFALGVIVIMYLIRFTMEKAFDMKPMEDA
ncbi:MAG: hypothetical protein ABSF82_04565 [Candidatus Bathyarchaeia archaeon]|jgi:hypothetical protein